MSVEPPPLLDDPREGARLRGEAKRAFARATFDAIAERYDAMNLLISAGQTSVWRWRALSGLRFPPGARVLDVGCGTGVSTRALARRLPGARITGLDLSAGMLAVARRRDPGGEYVEGDVTDLPFPEGAFDLVATLFTLRNFPDLDRALAEMLRVLRPGGGLLVLDTFPLPPGHPLGPFHRAWLTRAVPRLVRPFGDPAPYVYMAESILRHVPPRRLAEMAAPHGGRLDSVRSYGFGFATRLLFRKDA